MSFAVKLSDYINAGYSALYISTHEERRISGEVAEQLKSNALVIYEWDSLRGLTERDGQATKNIKDTNDPLEMFEKIKKICSDSPNKQGVYIIKDFHLQFDKPLKRIDYIRAVRNILPVLKPTGSILLFIAPLVKIPTELSKEIQIIDYKLPSEESIKTRLEFIHAETNRTLTANKKTALDLPEDIKEAATEAAKGMTDSEVENVFSLAIVKEKKFDRAFVGSVFDEKVQQIKKGGLLTYIPTTSGFDTVGGLTGVKEWVIMRKNAFTKAAREYGLPFPKGIGLAGIPGTGKTLISKAISAELGFPLFQLDIGSLFSKYVGETEQNMLMMIKTVESIGRCVLHIDEIEKYLNTGAVSGQGDSGTSSRSFGSLLSWLSDRTSPAFIVCTSNNHLILPPELIRKGRFDEWFWVDLPNADERKAIFEVVIKKYKRELSKFAVQKMVDKTDTYTGSEIDSAFRDAMFQAFARNEEITTEHVLKEITKIKPQSQTNSTQLDKMREKVEGTLRPATLVEDIDFVKSNLQVRKVTVK